MIRPPARAHLRGQSGISLVELLLVLLLTGMLMGPLTAWWILTVQSQPQIQADSGRIASTALVSQYLVRDVAVAGAAADSDATTGVGFNFQPCLGVSSSTGSDVHLVLVRSGDGALTKTVYVEKAAGGTATLWRQTCINGVPVEQQNSTEIAVADGLEPGTTTATCPDGGGAGECRSVELRFTPKAAQEIVVRGVRRVDVASADSNPTISRSPVAKITVPPNDGTQLLARPYVVDFSSESSFDPDGTIVCYQWAFTTVADGQGDPSPAFVTRLVNDGSPGAQCPDRGRTALESSTDSAVQRRTYATSGVFFVELTVTDNNGLSFTDYLRYEIEPRDPIAESRITALGGGTATAGETVFEFAAQWDDPIGAPLEGSRHPDGTIDRYVWTLTEGPDVAYRVERTTPDPWYAALPAEMAGNVSVTLTVFDDVQGRQAIAVSGVVLGEPEPDSTLPTTGVPVWTIGGHAAPSNVRVGGPTPASDTALVQWNAPAQADRYIVETADVGCGAGITSFRVVPAGTLSAPLLPAGCFPPPPPETTPPTPVPAQTVRVRIGAQVGAAVSWSPPLDYTVPAQRIDATTLEGGS
jgi:hypothetical protein